MNRTRPRQLIVRLSDKEMQKIKQQVAKSGFSQQDYVRLTLLDGFVTNTDGVKEVIPEMKRIGNKRRRSVLCWMDSTVIRIRSRRRWS